MKLRVCLSLEPLTSCLHEAEKVVQEFFTLFILVQLVQLKQREREAGSDGWKHKVPEVLLHL